MEFQTGLHDQSYAPEEVFNQASINVLLNNQSGILKLFCSKTRISSC